MNQSTFYKTHVTDVYEKIADEFDDKRFTYMPGTKEFLEMFNANEKILDVGCGTGINMIYNPDLNFTGIDNCKNFVTICKNKGLNVEIGDILNIEYGCNYFDGVMCISVIHHLTSVPDRLQAINELLRVCKVGGKILIQTWEFSNSLENKKFTCIDKNDYLVKWKNGNDRYYHLFTKEELIELIENVDDCKIVSFEKIRHNFSIVLEKIQNF